MIEIFDLILLTDCSWLNLAVSLARESFLTTLISLLGLTRGLIASLGKIEYELLSILESLRSLKRLIKFYYNRMLFYWLDFPLWSLGSL